MKKIKIFFVAIILRQLSDSVLLATTLDFEKAKDEFIVATYNVQRFHDLEYSAEFSEKKSPLKKKCQKIAKKWQRKRCLSFDWSEERMLIRFSQWEKMWLNDKGIIFDVILLQEVYRKSFLQIKGSSFYTGKLKRFNFFPQKNINSTLILWNPERFQFEEGLEIKKAGIDRPILFLSLIEKKTKRHFFIINVHLPSKRQSKKKRNIGLKELVDVYEKKYEKKKKKNDDIFIMGGDFNQTPKELERFCQKEKAFFCPEIEKRAQRKEDWEATYLSLRHQSRLDYLFFQREKEEGTLKKPFLMEHRVSGKKKKNIIYTTKALDLSVQKDRDIGYSDHLLLYKRFQ
jgi:exonuclease III